jgi:hypothetical protein
MAFGRGVGKILAENIRLCSKKKSGHNDLNKLGHSCQGLSRDFWK